MEGPQDPGRDELIQLILCQLSAYGYSSLSQAIATHTKVPMTADSNSRLAELVRLGLQSEKKLRGGGGNAAGADTDTDVHSVGGGSVDEAEGSDSVGNPAGDSTGAAARWQVRCKAKHTGVATVAAFSDDGRYVATGSADATVKLIDVDQARGAAAGAVRRDDKFVVRTLSDHDGGVTGLALHPNGLVLASCSEDRSIRLFDLSVAQGKHAFQSFRDSQPLRSIAFHPSGDYIAAGGDAAEMRLYSVRSGKAYLLAAGGGGGGPGLAHHSAGITHVGYAGSGAAIASASRDGSVKIWDGASGKCVRTIDRAHDGKAATAAVFSQDSKHVLTAGLDSCVRMWDAASGRMVQEYVGASADAASAQAVFSHGGAQVMAPDAATNTVAVWDAASGQLLAKVAAHSQRITSIAASPTADAFVTCSADGWARYWSPGAQ
ncbi:hypothetical protein LPJ61_003419 [Coemansia biformis]|uniref:Cleavage stimulation factor 50 kDa subunit n=1 Tax=Coemansia biformis TaxID=1286918 RepID=A0A9W7YD23_9FUNG|nr:hypothetical protein LPJ61_003419 [Coemansia biformis]